MDIKDKISVVVQTDWFKKTMLVLIFLLLFVGVTVLSFNIYEKRKSDEIQRDKEKIEVQFKKLDKILSVSDTLSKNLTYSSDTITTLLKDYKNLLITNHYENDSELIFINNVHIDTLLSRLPEFSGELDSL